MRLKYKLKITTDNWSPNVIDVHLFYACWREQKQKTETLFSFLMNEIYLLATLTLVNM